MSATPIPTAEVPALLEDLRRYERALSVVAETLEREDDDGLEAFERATSRLAEFAPLLERLQGGALPPEGPERAALETRLRAVRVRHRLLSQSAEQLRGRVDAALTTVREFRRKTRFYGASGEQLGGNCDIAG